MDLREAIRVIIREVAEPELRRIVREVILEELVAENPRTTAAKKAAATRAANRVAAPAIKPSKAKVPERARKFGVFRGQQYKGKPHAKKVKDRTIEVVRLDEAYIYPRILGSANKNAKAKRISYEHLQKNYDRVV
jgi:hypothetical protein